jgi:hypothetical protein
MNTYGYLPFDTHLPNHDLLYCFSIITPVSFILLLFHSTNATHTTLQFKSALHRAPHFICPLFSNFFLSTIFTASETNEICSKFNCHTVEIYVKYIYSIYLADVRKFPLTQFIILKFCLAMRISFDSFTSPNE